MKVPFFRPNLNDSDLASMAKVLSSGHLTTGPVAREFEQRFAEHIGAPDAVSVSSGTAALALALYCVGVRRNTPVILPSLTFTATAEAILLHGAIPIFVDCDRDTLCIDVSKTRQVMETLRERGQVSPALLPVHYGGVLADIDGLTKLASEFGVAIVHDAAHCLSSYYRSEMDDEWRPIGSLAGPTCFSLYANKCITAGEGGLIASSDPQLIERARLLSRHGIKRNRDGGPSQLEWDYAVTDLGFKANFPDLLASLGLSQLARSDGFQDRRSSIASHYRERLAGRIPAKLPAEHPDRRSRSARIGHHN